MALLLLRRHQMRTILMPTYEYKCASCFTTVEQERSLHSEAIAPTCCGGSMIRQWNSTAVHFKGTGFYKTGG